MDVISEASIDRAALSQGNTWPVAGGLSNQETLQKISAGVHRGVFCGQNGGCCLRFLQECTEGFSVAKMVVAV